MTHIILVEDDEKLSQLIQQYLQNNHFSVDIINDGANAVDDIIRLQPDLVILDLMLPNKDGLTICREIRPSFTGGIIFLTASDDIMDHVVGVELGADDFIIKPIQPRVLLARIRMLMRRVVPAATSNIETNNSEDTAKTLTFDGLTLHSARRAVSLHDQSVALTTSEFDLLWLLASHAEEVLSRDFIYQTLRGIEYDGMDRGMDTKVANLRKKLGDSASLSTRIITVRGQGYLFVPDSWA